MYNYNSQIKTFYDKKVSLPPEMRKMLLAHRKANADRLIKRLPELHPKIRIGESNFQSQGSFAMDTVVQTRFTAEEYDIDYGVVIRRSQLVNEDGSEMTAQEVRELVRAALRDKRFNRQPKLMTNCVRVFYADEDDYAHHVDIPIYREFEDDAGIRVTQLAGEEDWIRSNPTRVNEWIEDEVIDRNAQISGSGGQMRRMVKLMKRFCRSRNADSNEDWDLPNGMKLTMLISECFQWSERFDEAFHGTLSAMKNRLAWNLEIENLADKGWPKSKLTKSTADQNVLNLEGRIADALSELEVLSSDECTENQARKAWDWVFQSDGFFKELEEEAKAKKQELQKAAAILASRSAGTDRNGRIVAACATVVPNLAHSFYGEDF
ncbi:hypothetical protein EI77_03100 [Prosthecobacter fusiformis]|uniref:Cyclic GMP-AMP synthase n=1 Tax=Prosthecobacter fusiformis TaxID=48464 RepID=A0A4R7RX41_9BACT|nr:hypothetical protein [Prosthecobacter fusiformis]TDU69445.1 hypothetical protein EI77_03100 [Prosthecobacter fusiformis]